MEPRPIQHTTPSHCPIPSEGNLTQLARIFALISSLPLTCLRSEAKSNPELDTRVFDPTRVKMTVTGWVGPSSFPRLSQTIKHANHCSQNSVYFVSSNPNAPTALASLVEKLQATYSATPSGRWALEHKMFRDTPSCLPPSSYSPLPQLQPRSMQMLSLSHFQSHGFIYVSNRPDPDPWDLALKNTPTNTATGPKPTPGNPQNPTAQPQQPQSTPSLPPADRTMTTMDPQSFNSFLAITLRACEPLWCLRHTVIVQGGVAFTVSDFHIRLGDVRQTQPVNRVRGTVVEIEYRGPSSYSGDIASVPADITDGDLSGQNILLPPRPPSQTAHKAPILTPEDWVDGAALIREFWSTISVPGARDAILVPGIGTESREALSQGKTRLTADGAGDANDGVVGVDLARQYMEVFRFNR